MTRAAAVVPDAELDLRQSAHVRAGLPDLAVAFDEAAMADQLAATLGARSAVTGLEVGQASYLGESCLVRYRVTTPDAEHLVTGHVFADESACAQRLSELEQLAGRAGDRYAFRAFRRPVGRVVGRRMTLALFPIDAELPTLVDATDDDRMRGILGDRLTDLAGEHLDVVACTTELGHYGRLHRCVLRYHLGVASPGRPPEPLLVYGKLAADDRGAVVGDAVRSLRAQAGSAVAIPQMLGYLSQFRLGLFEALPGAPRVAKLVRTRLGADVPAQGSSELTLDQALASCARVAAFLHDSGLTVGPVRTLQTEAAALRRSFSAIRPVSPALADRLEERLSASEAAAGPAGALGFGHGDFSYTQLIFDGAQAGLVDFDTICQAEPALDLGHFLAYLDLAAGKAGPASDGALAGLRDGFFRSYAEARGLMDLEPLLTRAAAFETVSLLRLATHSWAKVKPRRLRIVLDALDSQPGMRR